MGKALSGRRALVMIGMPTLVAACRSPEPALYTILPQPGTPRRGASPRAVAVREVSLARYLDRQQIVRSAEGYRLDVAGNDWWGEPLEAMLTRVLVENLAQRLPAANVVASGGAVSAPSGAAVLEVNLQRLGLTAPTVLVLTAQLAVRPAATGGGGRQPREQARTETVQVPVEGTDTRAFVAAASAAVGRLADAAAAMLASG